MFAYLTLCSDEKEIRAQGFANLTGYSTITALRIAYESHDNDNLTWFLPYNCAICVFLFHSVDAAARSMPEASSTPKETSYATLMQDPPQVITLISSYPLIAILDFDTTIT